MSFNVYTPERQAKIAAYLRMIEKNAPVWDPEKLKALDKLHEDGMVIDSWKDLRFSPVCYRCANLTGDGYDRKCKAFINGIPESIWTGENKHINKLPGQKNDIVFELNFKKCKKKTTITNRSQKNEKVFNNYHNGNCNFNFNRKYGNGWWLASEYIR